MNKLLILVFFIAILLFVSTQEVQTEEKQKETETQQQQTQTLSKEEKQKLKEEAKLKKAEEKKQKQILKEQQKQQELQQKQVEKLQREQQKLQEQEEAEAQRQAQLKAEATQTCQQGQVSTTEGTCINCSENCESCYSSTYCNYCAVGFYRVVVEKKVNAYCSSTIPKGYLPQIKKFEEMNPQITHSVPEVDAIAYNGKTVISAQPTHLPFKITQNGPTSVKGEKVRLDVVPCFSQCKECAEGFLFEPTTKSCTTAEKCQFPKQIGTENGKQICIANDPSVFKGQIQITEKQPKSSETLPQKKTVSLKAITNQEDIIGITYEWSVKNSEGTDITADIFVKGNYGQKVKANITNIAQGSQITFNCLVKDTKIENHQGNLISQEYTI